MSGGNPDADWAAARQVWERGGSYREAAQAGNVTPEGVRQRALREGWVRGGTEQQLALDEQRRAQAQAAADASRLKWAYRRAEEADAAGVTAAVARQRVVAAMAEGDTAMTKAAAVAYAIFIDKAQLISGAPRRFELSGPGGAPIEIAPVLARAHEYVKRAALSAPGRNGGDDDVIDVEP